MSSATITQHFIEIFDAEVKMAYQRMGSKLQGTIRTADCAGDVYHFRTTGKGAAGTKARGGQVPLMNLTHAEVTATMADYYAAEFIDNLDQLKTNIDERMVAAQSAGAALGRQADALIIAAAETSGNATATTSGITLAKLEEVYEAFGDNDVPDDGQRYLVVSPQGWTDLLNLDQFANADYAIDRPWAGSSAKNFMGFTVMQHSGLSLAGSVRTALAYHRSAVGLAINQQIKPDVTWQGKEQSYLVASSMSMGAVAIDTDGIYLLKHTEV